jgi:D-glycero-alpha-D-manno-heptose-7-phosphate kinase
MKASRSYSRIRHGNSVILTKTPLRISFVGGGSDRPWFYQEEPGACVAAAIDKYVFVAVNPKYDGSIRAAYSQTENVSDVAMLQHELIREALRMVTPRNGIEVHSIADVPGGSGLGSSSSFTVGLLQALAPARDRAFLADWACKVEIERCHKPIGKQDQYTAAYGGVNLLGFSSSGVTVERIACDLDALSAHCLLLDTGLARSGDAGQVLSRQQQDRDDVRAMAAMAREFAALLTRGELDECGSVMNSAWQIKRQFVGERYTYWYNLACAEGAWGGKLCGAGGGGFLLFLAPPERHQAIVQALGLRHVPIRVGVPGSQVVYQS